MKTQSVKNFFISPFTVYTIKDPNIVLGKIKTWEKVLIVASSILLIPTIVGAPTCFFLASAIARRRNVKDLAQSHMKLESEIKIANEILYKNYFPKSENFTDSQYALLKSSSRSPTQVFTAWIDTGQLPATLDDQACEVFKLKIEKEEGEPAFHIMIDCASTLNDSGAPFFAIYVSDKHGGKKTLSFPDMSVVDFLERLGSVFSETLIEVKGEYRPLRDYITILMCEGNDDVLPHLTFTLNAPETLSESEN